MGTLQKSVSRTSVLANKLLMLSTIIIFSKDFWQHSQAVCKECGDGGIMETFVYHRGFM